jgi:hypothetical protein
MRGNGMKNSIVVLIIALIALAAVQVAGAEDDFYGIIESHPEGNVGTWIIGGRSIEVIESTDLDEDNGPLKTGACAEVDIDDGIVEEIESEPAIRCGR